MAEQQENVEKLLNNMRQLSEQSEQSEPLLHKNLYDAVRKAQTSGLEENLQETRDQLRYGSAAEAKDAERKAANAVDELQKGVEKAAESVLGSESEALRVAKNELDKLIKEAQEQEGGQKGQEGQESAQQASAKSDKSDAKGQKPVEKGEGEAQDSKTAEKGQQPGQKGEEGKEAGKSQGEPQDPKMAEAGQKPGEGQKQQQRHTIEQAAPLPQRGDAVARMLTGCFQSIRAGAFDVPSNYLDAAGRPAKSVKRMLGMIAAKCGGFTDD